MKKIALIAVAMLISLTGCKNNSATPAATSNTAGSEMKASGIGKVAYIEMDSLLMSYDMAIELRNTFQTKFEKAEKQLNAKYSKLEKDFMDAQEKMQKGLVTRLQAAELEEKLARQQQELMQSREALMTDLAEEEMVMNNRVFFAISDYLEEYNSDYKYSMIISTSVTGPILHADPAYNITDEVLKELNARYAREKSGKK